MRLVEVRLKNFRCFKDETAIQIDGLTALIGSNDAGKSTIMDALSIFFEEERMDHADVAVGGDPKDVCITCIFEGMPSSVVIDADHATTLADEYLLNTAGKLQILQRFNGSLKTPKAAIYAVANHPTAEGYDDLLSLKLSGLKSRLTERDIPTEGVSLNINSEMRRAIWDYADDLAHIIHGVEAGSK